MFCCQDLPNSQDHGGASPPSVGSHDYCQSMVPSCVVGIAISELKAHWSNTYLRCLDPLEEIIEMRGRVEKRKNTQSNGWYCLSKP